MNYLKWITDKLLIVNKKQEVVNFIPNKTQTDFLINMSGKDIILKSRQMGFSSIILAMFTADFILTENAYNVVVADIDDNATGLLARVKYYIQSYEERTGRKVPLKYNSKTELYNPVMNSYYKLGSAKNTQFGRSKTITNLHLCIGKGTKILCADGTTKPIEKININDILVAEDGKTTKVINKIKTGVKPLLKIKTWLSNEEILVSKDHKIRVMGKSKAWHYYRNIGEPIWKKAGELTTDNYILWAYPKTGAYIKFLTIPKIKNCIHLPINYVQKIANQKTDDFVVKTNYKLGYFLGYYLAEGNINKGRITFACHKDEEYYKKFIDLLPLKPTVEINKTKSGTRKLIIYYSLELASFIEKLVGKVTNKNVPTRFLYQFPKTFLKGLYEGWRDGDGSKAKLKWKCISITTIHEKIARQMKQIYALLNHRLLALDYHEKRFRYDKQTKPIYVLREHGFDKNKDHSKGASKQKYVITRNTSPKNGYLFVKIKSIEEVEEKETYDIEVDNKNHSFLTVCGVVSNSELAFYPDPESIFGSAIQAVVPNGRVIIETTANGFNWFKKLWDVGDDRGFKKHFYNPLWEYDQTFLDMKKKELDRLFPQEYPMTEEEAYLTSGSLYFDKQALQYYLSQSIEPITQKLIYE